MLVQKQSYQHYIVYIFHHEIQKYVKQNEFNHPGKPCEFVDIQTCLSILDGEMTVVQNIWHQKIETNNENIDHKELINVSLEKGTKDSKYIAGLKA
jgi:hypothetical protein